MRNTEALNMTCNMALNMTCNMALNMTCNMALNKTANGVTYKEPPVLSNGKWLLPSFLLDYFTEKTPDGNIKEDMDFYYFERITNFGRILTKTWGLPSTSCYFPKYVKFVMDGNLNSKHLKDIPGIGEVYAARMKTSLKGYCSVPQLGDMYLYWWRKGVPHYFFYLLHWATGADNNNGHMHIQRAFQAFRQKHLLSLPPIAPIVPWCTYKHVKIEDPHPDLQEIEF